MATRAPVTLKQPAGGMRGPDGVGALLRAGRVAWALVGVIALLVVVGFVAGRLTLVVVPLLLALFPAALLEPVSRVLKRMGLPAALAALVTILGSLLVLTAVVALLVPVVAAELPSLTRSLGQGVEQLLNRAPMDLGGTDELAKRARQQLGTGEQLAGRAMSAVTAVVEGVTGLLFGLVALFFYLKDGGRIATALRDLLPDRARPSATQIGQRVWLTLGRYFRGQLLIALVDAVLIGIGLVVLRIPLALPLSVLIFFGGLFPIVGAFVSGAVAVLVALADAGLTDALIVLAVVVGVQQLEGNVLEPVVLGRAIAVHPLLVLVSITTGAVTVGVLGAFLAVPVAASGARVVDYLRGRDGEEDDQADPEEGDSGPATVMPSSS